MSTGQGWWQVLVAILTSRVPVEGKSSVCDLYEIYDNNFNYYHYQPG